MPQGLGVFWREFFTHYHTTGAIAPSGRWLSAALARQVRDDRRDGPRRILEVGPGTGVVTRQIVKQLRPDDRLTLVELNDRFVDFLRDRFANDPALSPAAPQTEIIHERIENLSVDQPFDFIISGLPLNNFSVEAVEAILATFERLSAPGGTLSFFEYMLMRPLKAIVTLGGDRERLSGITRALGNLFAQRRIACDRIWANVPPALVHHVRLGELAVVA